MEHSLAPYFFIACVRQSCASLGRQNSTVSSAPNSAGDLQFYDARSRISFACSPSPLVRVLCTPACAMVACSAAVGALFRVMITGKIATSGIKNITAADTVTMSFLVDPTVLERVVEGHPVLDGIAPYPICTEDFSLKFSSPKSSMKFYLGGPPAPATPEAVPATTLYFSLQKSRPVYDGAWVSYLPDAVSDVPLEVHGSFTGGVEAVYNGRFGFNSAQFTFPSLDIAEAVGTYSPTGALHTFKIWRDWEANVVLTWNVDKITIARGATLHK